MKIKRSKRISFVRWTTIKESTRKRHYGFKNGYSDVFSLMYITTCRAVGKIYLVPQPICKIGGNKGMCNPCL